MPARDEPKRHGRRLARHITRTLGAEILAARLEAGISQTSAGLAAGMSHAQFGRIERGALQSLTFDQASRAAAAIGLRLVVKTYPDGDPARDAAHLATIERFRKRLPEQAVLRTEVPLPIQGDRRAWDAVLFLGHRRCACECETRLRDAQALERRLALKQRDGEMDLVILVVSDTRTNRAFLEQHREQLRGLLPLDSRQVLDAFRRGELPDRNGIVIV
jgi:transcriptional regulator with XRE-family HTH domain